jgi:hypothetical protein
VRPKLLFSGKYGTLNPVLYNGAFWGSAIQVILASKSETVTSRILIGFRWPVLDKALPGEHYQIRIHALDNSLIAMGLFLLLGEISIRVLLGPPV